MVHERTKREKEIALNYFWVVKIDLNNQRSHPYRFEQFEGE